MTRKNRRTRNKSIRKVERRVRSKRSNRKDKSRRKQRRTNRKQRRTNRKQRRTNLKQRRTNRKQRRVKRELYGGAGEPPGDAAPQSPLEGPEVQPVPAQSAESLPPSEQQGDTDAPVASLMETFGPSPYQLSKEGIKGAEAVLDETTRLEEKEKKIVFDETTSFQKIEELITKMKEDTCTGNISVDEPLKTYEEMKKYKNSMMRKLNDLNLRRNLRIDRDNYLENIKQEYDDLRINVFNYLTSKITSKRGDFESIMDYYKGLKTKQPAEWQPPCWECFKKIVAFATDPEFFSRFDVQKRDDDIKVLRYSTTNLVDKLITYNEGDTNLRDELKTKVKGYDRKFKDLKNTIEQNKKPRKTTTSEENTKKAKENLESVKQFFEDLDEEIKKCLNDISQWMLEDIQEMNTPQAQAKNALKELGISVDIVERMVAMLPSSSTPQSPVGDQPASEGSEPQANTRPDTPEPQPDPGPMGAQVGNDDDDGDGDDGKDVYGTVVAPGIVRPATPALTAMFPRRNPGRDLPPLPQRASASPPGPGTPGKPVPEAQLEEVDPKESPGTPGTPAPADVDTPPPPPGVSLTGRRRLELKPEPEEISALPDSTQQSPDTPVPEAEQQQQGPGLN